MTGPAGSGEAAASAEVVFFHAPGCHLCQEAFEVVEAAQRELGFPLRLVDVEQDAELERRYRALLPVVEIGGEIAFTYFVHPDALRTSLRARSVR